jgi:hypothetical protein
VPLAGPLPHEQEFDHLFSSGETVDFVEVKSNPAEVWNETGAVRQIVQRGRLILYVRESVKIPTVGTARIIFPLPYLTPDFKVTYRGSASNPKNAMEIIGASASRQIMANFSSEQKFSVTLRAVHSKPPAVPKPATV